MLWLKRLERTLAGRPVLAGSLLVLLLTLALADAARRTQWKAISNPNDFVTLYAGSFCLTHGCNPYNVPQLDAVLVEKRGMQIRQDWSDQLPIYPPTTMVLLLPLSLLSYKAATITWYLVSLAVYAFGLCWVFFASAVRCESSIWPRTLAVLVGLHFPKMLQCLGFGNPALIVTGLLLFAVFEKRASTKALRYLAAAGACLLKPPLALPLAGLLLLREHAESSRTWRVVAAFASVCVLVLLAAGYLPQMAHWRADLASNIAQGNHAGMNPSLRGTASNAILNVANLVGYFTRNTTVIGVLSWAVVALMSVLSLVLLQRIRRSESWAHRGYLLCAAALSAITLWPVYHRFCDIGVLLVVAPWVLSEFSRRPAWQAKATLAVLALLYFSWERRLPVGHLSGFPAKGLEFLYYRGDALLVLLLGCLLISAMVSLASSEARRPQGTKPEWVNH